MPTAARQLRYRLCRQLVLGQMKKPANTKMRMFTDKNKDAAGNILYILLPVCFLSG
jgi:hypothetical protein